MIVFSPLALYTTYLGWQQYDVMFNALWQTGILYIGFLMLGFRFLKSMLTPTESPDGALNRFLYELALTFFICAFFVYPCMPLEQKGLAFKPICTKKIVRDATINSTGTTYDEAFADSISSGVKAPIGFSILQNYISSLTYGLIKATGCTDSLQAIQGDLLSTYIPINIKKRVLQFHNQCFLEARSAYLNSPPEPEKVEAILKRFGGEEDLNWIGSKVLQTFYYDHLKAREPIPGFLFTKHPNPNFEEASKKDSNIKTHIPTHGYPTCNQWWSKIKKDLVKLSDKSSVFDKHIGALDITNRIYAYKTKHKLAWNSDLSAEDYIAKMLLQDNRDLQIKSTQSLMDNTNGVIGTFITRGLINTGQNIKSWTTTPLKREAIIQILPVIHAFFYFFLVILTPLILALSGYSTRALGSICALFMISIFIQFIWHLVGFVERAVLDPMGENNIVAAMRNMAVLFYIIAPMLLLKLSSHFGGEAGDGLAGLLTISEKTANESVETSSAAAKTGMRIASKGVYR